MNRLVLLLLPAALLAGCGPAVNPDEIHGPACQAEVCWDLSQVSELRVNDFPIPDRLVQKEAHGWKFKTTVGRTYTVKAKVTSGSAHTYVSSKPLIDPANNNLTDLFSNNGILFKAGEEAYYIAVQDTGNVRGSDYSVRIISTEESLDPLPGTAILVVNDNPKAFSLIPGEVRRFMFSGIRGQDYTVQVRILRGGADTFLSRIPSVDEDAYDLADFFSNDDLQFRAVQTATYYIGVVDLGRATGSDFTIQVTSP